VHRVQNSFRGRQVGKVVRGRATCRLIWAREVGCRCESQHAGTGREENDDDHSARVVR
jgi:hypothetical protein